MKSLEESVLAIRSPRGRMLPLILKFALPSVLSAAVIALYSLADAYFVSSLGKEAGAAVGVSFAIQALLQAVGYTFGIGGGVLISRSLGAKDIHAAARYAGSAMTFATGTGCAILLLGLGFRAPLMRLLGATDSIYPLALSYATNLLLSAPFTTLGFVLSQLLRAEGRVFDSTFGLTVGSAVNCILDPICITRLGMGVAGASFATLISQAVSTLLLLLPYLRKKSCLPLFEDTHRPAFGTLPKILYRGMPSFFRQGLIVLATVILNRTAAVWSDAAVSALSTVTRLFLLAFSLCLGVGQGMMPIVAYNDGQGRSENVRRAYVLSLWLGVALSFVASIPLLIFSDALIALFQSSPEATAIGSIALRAQAAVLILHAPITCTIFLMQALGRGFRATLIACARQGIFFVPLIVFIPRHFGVEWVIFVQPLADLLTFLLTVPFMVSFFRQTKEKVLCDGKTPCGNTIKDNS